MENLIEKIEQQRSEMISLSCSYGLASDVVVQSSKQLDKLLNEYHNQYEAASA
ncbi:aspartyl-phosphate phosphatase Spo0E family protein [Lentibacillus sp. N15]|uniref:aspartyl-phosphate phosphatase Spo0E family protein n=1 Tax=Lentibacillus songyuanensis TaxID=3136161 RepID=UPI0031BA3FF3